jgi:hypothetical protein
MAYSLARGGFNYAALIVIVTSFEITCRECIIYALTEDRRRMKAFKEKTVKVGTLIEINFNKEEVIRRMIRSIDFLDLKENNSIFERVFDFKLKDIADNIDPSVWTLLKLTILLRHQIVHHGGRVDMLWKQKFEKILNNMSEEDKNSFRKIIGEHNLSICEDLTIKMLSNMESFLNKLLDRIAHELGIAQ